MVSMDTSQLLFLLLMMKMKTSVQDGKSSFICWLVSGGRDPAGGLRRTGRDVLTFHSSSVSCASRSGSFLQLCCPDMNICSYFEEAAKPAVSPGMWTLSPPRRLHMDSVNMKHVLRWLPLQDNCSTAILYSVQFQG